MCPSARKRNLLWCPHQSCLTPLRKREQRQERQGRRQGKEKRKGKERKGRKGEREGEKEEERKERKRETEKNETIRNPFLIGSRVHKTGKLH